MEERQNMRTVVDRARLADAPVRFSNHVTSQYSDDESVFPCRLVRVRSKVAVGGEE